jgi:putative ABC transport system substrate-binding protein
MQQREFITLLGSAAAWLLPARTQQAAVPVVGFLRSTSRLIAAFQQGLKLGGYI